MEILGIIGVIIGMAAVVLVAVHRGKVWTDTINRLIEKKDE